MKEPLLPTGNYAAEAQKRFLSIWRRPSVSAPPELHLDTRNPFGQEIAMLVTDTLVTGTSTANTAGGDTNGSSGAWYRVLLPERPNGSEGWVRGADVDLVPEREQIVVDLSSASLTHYRGGHVADAFRVGIGSPASPTTEGTFYVWARVPQRDPSGPYGVYALGISGFSTVITDWPGGGRMAIHGTPTASDRGQALSHGCVRVFNSDMRKLRHVPLGTPVVIQA
jgi:hypothetical protein